MSGHGCQVAQVCTAVTCPKPSQPGSLPADTRGSSQNVICPTIFDPYCDVDGKTYSNFCVAHSRKATLACHGKCPCPGTADSGKKSGSEKECRALTIEESPSLCHSTGCCVGIGLCVVHKAAYSSVGPKPKLCQALLVPGSQQASAHWVACERGLPDARISPTAADLLAKVKEQGGVLIVPTDELLLAQLAILNATVEDVASDKRELQSLLADSTVLKPTLNLKVCGPAAAGMARHCV
jgi:hypothetical protein